VVTEEHQSGVVALRRTAEQIERGVVVEKEVAWVTGLRANDIWSLDRVATEENGEVQANNVVVALLCVELDGEATRVTGLIGKLSSQSDGREAHKDGGLFADGLEKIRFLQSSSR